METWSHPSYPLSLEEFRRALHVGSGRAYVHINRFGTTAMREEILAATTRCTVPDPQVDGLRSLICS